MKTIYTIGHSNHPIAHFIGMLQVFEVKVLVDVRSMPGSKWNHQFNLGALSRSLGDAGIQYIHMPGLGGRHKLPQGAEQSKLKSYAGYMETTLFKSAIAELKLVAADSSTAYMCSEAAWDHCHRAYISDHLKAEGWKVMHITALEKATEHPDRSKIIKQASLF